MLQNDQPRAIIETDAGTLAQLKKALLGAPFLIDLHSYGYGRIYMPQGSIEPGKHISYGHQR